MKNKSAGFLLTIITLIVGVVGLVAYLVNTGTSYFASLGVSPIVAGCAGAAVVALLVYLIVDGKSNQTWADILPVAASALLMISAIMLVSVRVAGIASIMTFESNASNMSDMTGAIIAIAVLVVAAILSIIASFFDVSKE
ncbi:MAG: hypothetical protein LUH48_07625 [Clostridiales bacterium]|nr:hypothetical protein [Clostridiales bacterium]